jgi:hypothetical protein
MQIENHNQRYFDGNLDEVFGSLMNVKEVRALHDAFFYDVLLQAQPKKPLRKAEMTENLCNLNKKPALMQQFIDALSQEELALYTHLLWNDYITLEELESQLGFKVHTIQIENDWRREYKVFKLQSKYHLACLSLNSEGRYHSFTNVYRDAPANYLVRMPPAIRQWLKPYFPKPEGYDLKTISDADFPKVKHQIFDASPSICNDLAQLADYLKRGTVTRTKKGTLTKASLRKAQNLIESGDWYPDKNAHPKLKLMRIEMLLDFIECFSPKTCQTLMAPKPDAKIFKTILKEIQQDPDILCKWLLDHLKERYKYYESTCNSSAIKALFDLFKQMPREGWVSTENLKRAQFYQDINILFYDNGHYLFRMMTGTSYRYETELELKDAHLQKVGIEPLIDGTLFLLSAFGYLELAYQDPPTHPRYGTEKEPYLTRYDGAIAVRLTDIGAYTFGQSKQLDLKQSGRQLATITPHQQHLHLTCRDLDPITEQTLQEYMECVGPNFYKLTRASMLKGCRTPKELKLRIEDFKRRIPVDLPENWQQFLTNLTNEKSALVKEPLFSVYTLAGRPELQQLFLSDPKLRGMTWRVEGHRIAIEQQNIDKVRAHLSKLGYLV